MLRHDSKRIHFGITTGFNLTNFHINRSEAFVNHDSIKVVNSPKKPGFIVGIVSDLHLGKHTDLRFIPTLILSDKYLYYTEYNIDGDEVVPKIVESIILNFPISFKYKSDRFYDNFRFYVLSGARFDWDFSSNKRARKATEIVKIQPFDIAAEVGMGLEFYFPLFIFAPEIKISQGIFNTHVPTPNLRYSEVLESLRSKYITISFQFEG